MTPESTQDFTRQLANLRITIDAEPNESGALSLALLYTLTFYHAAYLELALRTGSTLATRDRRLRAAAAAAGVPLLPA